MVPAPRLVTRRTAVAWIAAAVAALGAILLQASEPDPTVLSPPRLEAVGHLPPAPGAIAPPPAAERPRAPASVLTAIPGDRELLWTERGSGRVRRGTIDGDQVSGGEIVAELAVRGGAAGGVRGLAAAADGRVYASYVRAADRRLVVAEIGLPRARIVWVGPRAGVRRVGGGLVALPGGRLVLAVGDQGGAYRARTSEGVAGRVISLDPDRGPRQVPRRRSRGWHDPTAIARARGGRLWIADRAGGPDRERTGRGDRPGLSSVASPFRRAPVALAVSGDGGLLVACGYLSGRLDRAERRGELPATIPQVLPTRCRYGLAIVGDRVLVSADDGRIHDAGTVEDLRRDEPLRDGTAAG
ncbi:hypothetical protein PAI11_30270 [Patulibacter medicamentivorans]|uniref:Uncharacterized protein n=1 Tax=Patulibacter medicamentivorans TaxID=1097667 RepID=H0E869_9ACTN|nr:PQQ-dependent sugar dehydrogenase [Patulibacter medicamentivorans]EHN10134.1 hypothetical protein PAI11_30270 [Patulibacter medicamentivorans]